MTLADLYEAHEAMLLRYANNLTQDADRADDLVQETFIRAMGHLTLIAMLVEQQQRAWLRRTLKNLFLDEQRRQQRQAALVEQLGFAQLTATTEPFAALLSPDPFALLPAESREIFEKRYILGMNSSEIAEELGIPAATVRSRLHFALKKLRIYQSNYQ